MERFSQLRKDLGSAMSAEEPNKDNIAALDKEIKEVYNRIMNNPNMIVFEGAQQALETLVNNIQQIITLCANGEDPATCQPQTSSCTGSCSTCGGCS